MEFLVHSTGEGPDVVVPDREDPGFGDDGGFVGDRWEPFVPGLSTIRYGMPIGGAEGVEKGAVRSGSEGR